jgi:hypothetical protein
MPSVKEFKKSQKVQSSEPIEDTATELHEASQEHHKRDKAHAKRRPGREAQAENKTAAAAEPVEVHVETTPAEPQEDLSDLHSDDGKKKIEISFAGSEILRAKLPKPFAVAEAVATDWVNDGKFEDLQIGHPLAQMAASAGLKKAKAFEKKLVESGVIEKVAMQALTAAMRAQTEINSIRDQVKAKFGKK